MHIDTVLHVPNDVDFYVQMKQKSLAKEFTAAENVHGVEASKVDSHGRIIHKHHKEVDASEGDFD